MVLNPLPAVRRIVTANDGDGRSRFTEDGPSGVVKVTPDRPGYVSNNIWRTAGAPTPVTAADSIAEHTGVMPPARGTVLRVIDYPPRPEDPEERRRQASASMRAMFPDATHQQDHDQAGMHVTPTIDYAIVLVGTITAIMDDGETDLHAGDILIQRATNHAWENRTQSMARIAFILIDGE